MAGTTTTRRRRLGLLAILALAFATALLVQPFGYNQGAHYALVRALADGTPRIDAYRDFSGDIGYYKGHYYSNKAPGLAFVTLPVYKVAHSLGLPSGVHVLSLWGVLLPGILLLLLVWRVGDRIEPGYGFAAAFTLGIATLVLPFLGMYFAHVLSALLGFAAFAVLWSERDGPPRPRLVAVAGLLAGFAVVVEYPLALTAVVLGFYAISRRPVLKRGLVWTAGVVVGLLPLLAFNQWAFGSFTQLSYSHLVVTNKGGHVVVAQPNRQEFQPRVAVELLLSPRGLLTLAPVVALGMAGAVFLYRRRRAEALTLGAVAGSFLLYNTSFIYFGGFGPGPRYLIPALPFATVGLAAAYRRVPVTTLALAAVSAAVMVLATITEPLLPNNEGPGIVRFGDVAHPSRWLERLWDGAFTDTVFAHAGLGQGWLSIAPVLAVLAGAVALAAAAVGRLEVTRRDAECAAVAVAGWLVALLAAPRLLRHDRFEGGVAGVWAVVALLLAIVLACVATYRAAGRGKNEPALRSVRYRTKEETMALQIGDTAPDFEADTTEGRISFHDWIGDSWAVLFSHPKDFTPVCTTELGYMAKIKPEFDKRGVKIIGLSVDPTNKHEEWANDIKETQGEAPNYPIIGDADFKVSKQYGMLANEVSGDPGDRTPADNQTVRNVFVIGPDKKIKLILVYPMTTGRNFDEVLRVIDSLQLTAKHKVATPVNWQQGDDVIIAGSVSDDEAKETYPEGWESPRPYIRIVPQPH